MWLIIRLIDRGDQGLSKMLLIAFISQLEGKISANSDVMVNLHVCDVVGSTESGRSSTLSFVFEAV